AGHRRACGRRSWRTDVRQPGQLDDVAERDVAGGRRGGATTSARASAVVRVRAGHRRPDGARHPMVGHRRRDRTRQPGAVMEPCLICGGDDERKHMPNWLGCLECSNRVLKWLREIEEYLPRLSLIKPVTGGENVSGPGFGSRS